MTIDEAIRHCEEVAEQNETQADKWQEEGGEQWGKTTACRECAADHRQLAEWLTELKDLREENKVLISECDRLIKEKGELLSKVSGGDVLRICRLEEQLEKAKRLLKSAIDEWHIVCEWGNCGEYCGWYVNGQCSQKWSGEAEALKLIES
jgi:hypothetical protein